MNILLCSTPLQKTLGIVLQITEREREKKWESKRKKPEKNRVFEQEDWNEDRLHKLKKGKLLQTNRVKYALLHYYSAHQT